MESVNKSNSSRTSYTGIEMIHRFLIFGKLNSSSFIIRKENKVSLDHSLARTTSKDQVENLTQNSIENLRDKCFNFHY